MSASRFSARPVGVLFAILLLAAACVPTDPTASAMAQRARWNVTLLSWSQATDGTLTLSVRLSGPPRSDLDALTVRVLLSDESGAEVQRFWHTLDLSGIERGGPADRLIRAGSVPLETAGAGIDQVLAPTEEELPHIVELRDL
jgi:hypothetical protein